MRLETEKHLVRQEAERKKRAEWFALERERAERFEREQKERSLAFQREMLERRTLAEELSSLNIKMWYEHEARKGEGGRDVVAMDVDQPEEKGGERFETMLEVIERALGELRI